LRVTGRGEFVKRGKTVMSRLKAALPAGRMIPVTISWNGEYSGNGMPSAAFENFVMNDWEGI